MSYQSEALMPKGFNLQEPAGHIERLKLHYRLQLTEQGFVIVHQSDWRVLGRNSLVSHRSAVAWPQRLNGLLKRFD
jgi:hypothetical protein